MSTEPIAPTKERKKRIRKPAPTAAAKVLAQATDLDLEEKICLRDELNKQLEAECVILTAKLKSLGVIGVE